MSRLVALLLLLLTLCALSSISLADDSNLPDSMSEEDILAEEMAAAAVGEAAEEEEEDDADAMDEEADSARLDSSKHPLTDMPPPANDILIAHAFATGLQGSVATLGETIKAVIAFANNGRMNYHVWGVMGSLNFEQNPDIFVQNFTYGHVNKTVLPGNELSFSYLFTPNERLDLRPFQLALSVFYEAQGSTGKSVRGHSSTFYNATVETLPAKGSMSNATFMILFALFVVACGAAGYAIKMMGEKKEKKEPEMGTQTVDKNEWLEEHHTMTRTGGGRLRNRSGKQ